MPAISRKKSNPNQPPDEIENEEDDDEMIEEGKRDQNASDIQREILDEDSDDSNDSCEEKDQVETKL